MRPNPNPNPNPDPDPQPHPDPKPNPNPRQAALCVARSPEGHAKTEKVAVSEAAAARERLRGSVEKLRRALALREASERQLAEV